VVTDRHTHTHTQTNARKTYSLAFAGRIIYYRIGYSVVPTDKQPLSVGDEVGRVARVLIAVEPQVDACQVVRPRAELHGAPLVVEREPADVDLAGAKKHARRHPEAAAVRRYYHVRVESAVNVLVRADNS